LGEEEFDTAERNRYRSAFPFFDILDIEEVGAQFFFGDLIRRFVEMFCELSYGADVTLLSFIRESF